MSQISNITGAAWGASGAASAGSTGFVTCTGWTHSTDAGSVPGDVGYRCLVGAEGSAPTFKIDANTVPLATGVGEADQTQAVRLLEQHAAGHDDIGPVEIGVVEVFRVAVDEADGPLGRQHRRERDEAEGDCRILCAQELGGDGVHRSDWG